ncbi:MAG: C40 family peptidase [Ignavibacteriaceae bacterium]
MKKRLPHLILSFFPIIILILVSACSSSNTVRYGKETKEEESKRNTVRFTSADDSMIVDLNLDLKDPSDLPSEEPDVDFSKVFDTDTKIERYDLPGFDYTTIREQMLMEIIKYLGTPYKYGGTTKNGIDCSAFTQMLYKDVFKIDLQRSARLQFTQGEEIPDKDDLQFGDLVFFNTRKRVKPGHVGVYIGENRFAHASSAKGVTISLLDYDYYSRTYMGARRIDKNGLTDKTN